jgi:CheY-like chemotaxis protein
MAGTGTDTGTDAVPRLLYVDDEEALTMLVPRLLARLGYQVTSESDPECALRRFREAPESFDGVVSDLTMPGMSGFDLAREVLALRPGLPVILASGYVSGEDEEAARKAGVLALVQKPDTIDEMAAAIDRAFRAGPPPA